MTTKSSAPSRKRAKTLLLEKKIQTATGWRRSMMRKQRGKGQKGKVSEAA